MQNTQSFLLNYVRNNNNKVLAIFRATVQNLFFFYFHLPLQNRLLNKLSYVSSVLSGNGICFFSDIFHSKYYNKQYFRISETKQSVYNN